MSGLNCHFVSRFLTQPWEYGERRLSHFDFERDALGSCSSRTLFAVRNANTPEVEASLNRLVETPISIAMARLLATHGVREEALEWSLVRAVSLLLMLQPVRASGHAERLEDTVTRTDAELDELARAAGALYRIGRITLNEHLALLYPAAGFFPLVGRQEDGSYGLAIGLPVSRRHAFIAVLRIPRIVISCSTAW
jgi:hypothetical protein